MNLATRGLIKGQAIYRKIDSTLRGHVALEIAATLEVAGPAAFAVVCPAYPVTGRTVMDGSVFVNGEPLDQTEIWRRSGRGSTHIPTLLAEAGVKTRALPLSAVRGGALTAAVEAARAVGARAVVCDAETDADLAAIIAATLAMPGALWAGSGGMTIPLAQALSPRGAPMAYQVERRAGPTLVAVGSASTVSREQLAVLTRDPRTHLLAVSSQALWEGPDAPGWRPVSRALVNAIGKPGQDVVAVVIDPAAEVEPTIGPALAANLGLLLGRQLNRFGALVATGGETARAVLGAVGATAMSVRQEIEPGVVLSTVDGLPVVTKAGAFGDPSSLARAVEALRALPLAPGADLGASIRP